MLRTADLDYHLPEELIATSPVSPRDSARLLVLRRSDPASIEHRHVRDLPEYLVAGDVMVVNRTHVLPARLRGVRVDTGGKAEGLFVAECRQSTGCHGLPGDLAGKPCEVTSNQPLRWQVLLKLRRAKPDAIIRLDTSSGSPGAMFLRLIERVGLEAGEEAAGWVVQVEGHGPNETTQHVLDRVGLTPLPPYILAARRRHEQPADDGRDRETYQTVYAAADTDESHGRGSVAAPTAGLHFTPELLARIAEKRVTRAEVVLHVGMGTFKPVETEFVEQHAMHSEWCSVPEATACAIDPCSEGSMPSRGSTDPPRSRRVGGTVLAIGTTTARTLESFASLEEMLTTRAKQTRILITPGHRFRHVGALMTNFHLPRSTLMAMVAAFLDDDDRVRGQGVERLLAAYRAAVNLRYRFYSFGDAMVVVS